MMLNLTQPVADFDAPSAMVIDFEAHKAARRASRVDAAAPSAAAALARFEAGRGSWTDLMAALVAPFQP